MDIPPKSLEELTDPNIKPKRKVMQKKPLGGANNWKPENTGKAKKHPLHMSVDELIEYKQSGAQPKMIIDPQKIYEMSAKGHSMKTICGFFGMSLDTFVKEEVYLAIFEAGRAVQGKIVREKLLETAIDDGNVQALVYLDKILSKEQAEEIRIEVKQDPLQASLSGIPTSALLEVAYTQLTNMNAKADMKESKDD